MERKISMGINLRRCKNFKNTNAFGKYYPEVEARKALSLRGFVESMVNHGCPFGRTVVEGVMQQISSHLTELLGQGVPVKFPALGTFYPTAEVEKDAGVGSIAEMDGLDINEIVKGIHIRFLPDCSKLDNLTSTVFKNTCELELRNIIGTKELIVDGKPKRVKTLVPVATAVAEYKAANPSGGGETPSGNTGNETPGGNTGTIDTGGTGTGDNTGGNTGGGNNPDPNDPNPEQDE